MKLVNEFVEDECATWEDSPTGELSPLQEERVRGAANEFGGVVIGRLIGIKNGGLTPLVSFPRQLGVAAIAARSVVDLRAAQIGEQVVLTFEDADPSRPIIMGALREHNGLPFETKPGQVEVQSDGERLIVSAKEELVLRCGDASITLTKEGKVLLRGKYLSTHASGVNRDRKSVV